MSTGTRTRSTQRRPTAKRHLRAAWISVVLIPVAFALSMVAGEALLTAFGYGVEDTIPLGVVAAAAGPALLILFAPAVAAVWYGFKARREGASNGIYPAVIGIVLGAFSIITNLGSLILTMLE